MFTNTKYIVGMLLSGLILIAGCGGTDGPGTGTGSGGTGGGGTGGGGTGGGGTVGCSPGCSSGFVCQGSSCVIDPTGLWTIRITSGTVASRNSSGSSWDADLSAPDPKVCLTINGSRSCTQTIQDSYTPTWNTSFNAATATALQSGINIEYLDSDLTSDDPICSGMLSVSSSDFQLGSWGFVCQSGQSQVSALLIAK